MSIRTQPNLPTLDGALNAFQATLRLSSTTTPSLYTDIDLLVFLQRARTVPSQPNASSSTVVVSLDTASRVTVYTGQTHRLTFQSSSAVDDAISFDFTGTALCDSLPASAHPCVQGFPAAAALRQCAACRLQCGMLR